MGVCPFTHLAYAVFAKPYLAFVPDIVENVDFAPGRTDESLAMTEQV